MHLFREIKLVRRCPSCGAFIRDRSKLFCNACLRKRLSNTNKSSAASAPSDAHKGAKS